MRAGRARIDFYLSIAPVLYKMKQGGDRMKERMALVTVALLLVIATLFWVAGSDLLPGPALVREIGLLAAALGLVLLFVQYVLVSRIKFIEKGFGLDKIFVRHRFFGRAGLVFLVLHVTLIAFYRIWQFGELFPSPNIYVGLAALLGLIITGALASQHKRLGLRYETWRGVHLFNYLLFPLALIHVFNFTFTGSALYYLWLMLALLFTAVVLYRLGRIYAIRKNPYRVTEVRQEAEDIWSLFFEGKKVVYNPGQFMFIQLLRGGKLSSPHPFTISSTPTGKQLSITPRELGDFTATIKDTRPGDLAYIDAPYGVFSFTNYDTGDLVFVAGGIGITPFISMLRYLRDKKLDKKVTLFWTNRSEDRFCFREELDSMKEEMPGFEAVMFISGSTKNPGSDQHLSGSIIKEHLGSLGGKDFFVCGPPSMTRAITEELKGLGVSTAKIHFELFQL
jgi:predicted ferric reductase